MRKEKVDDLELISLVFRERVREMFMLLID